MSKLTLKHIKNTIKLIEETSLYPDIAGMYENSLYKLFIEHVAKSNCSKLSKMAELLLTIDANDLVYKQFAKFMSKQQ